MKDVDRELNDVPTNVRSDDDGVIDDDMAWTGAPCCSTEDGDEKREESRLLYDDGDTCHKADQDGDDPRKTTSSTNDTNMNCYYRTNGDPIIETNGVVCRAKNLSGTNF